MSFRSIELDHRVKGMLLASVESLFPDGVPTVAEYAKETGVAPSTFRRAATWLLGLLPSLLRQRRPGPAQDKDRSEGSEREAALGKLEDLRVWLTEARRQTAQNRCFTPEAKRRIASLSDELKKAGILGYAEITQALGIAVRQLTRIRSEVTVSGGEAPEEKSRRPHLTSKLAGDIQELIAQIVASADSRRPYGPTDVKRILEKNYKEKLKEHHGRETIALSTVAKYMGPVKKDDDAHPRGSYSYPEPFQLVAIDTSHFKLFGRIFYFITVLEMAGRVNLLTRVFLRENTAAVVSVVEEYLERYPGIEATVIDRGTPYLNEEVKARLESRGGVRIVAPPATPTAKAACERHFRTLKTAIEKAAEATLARYASIAPERLALALEFGTAVFQELYHQIPQEGIDGKSPAERVASFDPVRAARKSMELFERALDSEPAEETARRLYRHFQLPGTEAETVKQLRQFGTGVLRELEQQVRSFMPPIPSWMRDPLGYLAAKARRIWEQRKRAQNLEKLVATENRVQRQAQEKWRAALEQEVRDRREQPERFVDQALALVVRCVQSGFGPGLRIALGQLEELLQPLSEKLGRAFEHEVERLKARVTPESNEQRVQGVVHGLLDRWLVPQTASRSQMTR